MQVKNSANANIVNSSAIQNSYYNLLLLDPKDMYRSSIEADYNDIMSILESSNFSHENFLETEGNIRLSRFNEGFADLYDDFGKKYSLFLDTIKKVLDEYALAERSSGSKIANSANPYNSVAAKTGTKATVVNSVSSKSIASQINDGVAAKMVTSTKAAKVVPEAVNDTSVPEQTPPVDNTADVVENNFASPQQSEVMDNRIADLESRIGASESRSFSNQNDYYDSSADYQDEVSDVSDADPSEDIYSDVDSSDLDVDTSFDDSDKTVIVGDDDGGSSSSSSSGSGVSGAIPIGLGVGAAGAAGIAGVRYIKNRDKNNYDAEYDSDEYEASDDNYSEENEETSDKPVDTYKAENINNLEIEHADDIRIEDDYDYEDDFNQELE